MAVSGQITIATPGIAIQGPSEPGSIFLLKAHPSNTGLISVISGLTSGSTSGFMLASGDQVIRECANLSGLYFDATIPNSIAMWFKIKE